MPGSKYRASPRINSSCDSAHSRRTIAELFLHCILIFMHLYTQASPHNLEMAEGNLKLEHLDRLVAIHRIVSISSMFVGQNDDLHPGGLHSKFRWISFEADERGWTKTMKKSYG